jgi:hypothetical protein
MMEFLLPFDAESFVIQLTNRNKILPIVLCGCETWSFTLERNVD